MKISSVYIKKGKSNISHIPKQGSWVPPETHTKRQATHHDCLPSLLGDGDKGIEIVYGEEKIFCTGPTRASKAEQKSLLPARQAQRTNQESAPFICPLWVPIRLSFNHREKERGKVERTGRIISQFCLGRGGGGDATREEAGLNLPSWWMDGQKVATASLHLYSLVCCFSKS